MLLQFQYCTGGTHHQASWGGGGQAALPPRGATQGSRLLGLLLLLRCNPGLDCAPEVSKSGEGGPYESPGVGPIGVLKGKGDGGDLPFLVGRRVTDPGGGLLNCEGCVAGVVCCQFLMDVIWSMGRRVGTFASENVR